MSLYAFSLTNKCFQIKTSLIYRIQIRINLGYGVNSKSCASFILYNVLFYKVTGKTLWVI